MGAGAGGGAVIEGGEAARGDPVVGFGLVCVLTEEEAAVGAGRWLVFHDFIGVAIV